MLRMRTTTRVPCDSGDIAHVYSPMCTVIRAGVHIRRVTLAAPIAMLLLLFLALLLDGAQGLAVRSLFKLQDIDLCI
jgi:hypothetical protein